ncbi:hypothetical protein GGI03_002982 [Coemansia sp. RSA 2337]|nr:hypothetical protein GGI03_002982 [Coemansia sp. RSA 2337]
MDPVDNNVMTPTDIEQTDAQQVIEHVNNFEAVAPYESPDLRDLMAAHALLSLAGALTAAPSVQHNSTGSNTVLAVAASTASGSTAAPAMAIQDTSIIISTPATVPVVTAPPYCGMYSTVAPSNLSVGPLVQYRFIGFGARPASSHRGAYTHARPTSSPRGAYSTVAPSNLSAGPLVQYRANSFGVASASRHCIHSLVQPTRYHRGTYSTATLANLSAGPLVQYRPTNSDAASVSSPHGAHAHARPTSSHHGAYSTVAPSNLSAGPSVQYRVTNSGAASTSRHHSADAHVRSTSAYNGIYIHLTPANFNTGPSIDYHFPNSDAAPANPVAGPSVKRRASNPQQPKRQRENSYVGSAIVISSDSEAGEGASNAGQDTSTVIIRDVAGEEVTLARFSSLFKRFIFLGFDMILVVYLHLVGRELAATPSSLQELYRQLEAISGFEMWAHGTADVSGSFLVRSGPVHQQMRRKLYRRLRIAQEAQVGVVTAPVLYFHVATIGCIHAKQLVKAAPLEMFKAVTGCDLGSRWIVSENGPISFTGSRYCELAREWLLNICKFITKDDRMEPLLTTADDCYKAYEKAGRDRGNKGAIFDLEGSIGQEILQSDDLALKLVIGLSYVDILELYEVLPCMVDGMFDKDKSDYLKRVSSFASNQLKLLPEH